MHPASAQYKESFFLQPTNEVLQPLSARKKCSTLSKHNKENKAIKIEISSWKNSGTSGKLQRKSTQQLDASQIKSNQIKRKAASSRPRNEQKTQKKNRTQFGFVVVVVVVWLFPFFLNAPSLNMPLGCAANSVQEACLLAAGSNYIFFLSFRLISVSCY